MKVLFQQLGQLFFDHQLFLVGGSVRDQLLGREAKDLDFATDAEPEVIKELLESWADAVWDPGLAFGTIAAKKGDDVVEITTFRADGPGRKPEVTFVKSLDEDLKRRDFTINAMAIRVGPDGLGDLQDPFNGMAALGLSVLDTPGMPEITFNEDPLRMLRAARFVSQLNFDVSSRVAKAMEFKALMINDISAERIAAELDKLLMGQNPQRGLALLRDTGILKLILPEALVHSAITVLGDDVETRWADLMAHIDPAVVGARLRALKFSNERVRTVTGLVTLRNRFAGISWSDAEIRKVLAASGLQFLRLVKLLRASDTLLPLATKLLTREGWPEPIMTGQEVMDILNIKPGPLVGQALAFLWNERLEKGPMRKDKAAMLILTWHRDQAAASV